MTDTMNVNFFQTAQTYDMYVTYPEPPPSGAAIVGRSGSVHLSALDAEEVEVFARFFIRSGADGVNISRRQPFSFGS